MTRFLAAAAALFFVAVTPSLAKDAICYTTDDGRYPCTFFFTEGEGSFRVSAYGYPDYELVTDGPGSAWVYMTMESGGRAVPLPGPYYRSESDGACWQNPETNAELCAW